ncbi:MAG: hypothetical protein ACLGH3_04235 [Actinomycetota bacterium]
MDPIVGALLLGGVLVVSLLFWVFVYMRLWGAVFSWMDRRKVRRRNRIR